MPASWSWASTTARGRTGGHGTQPQPGTRAACLARAPRSPAPSANGRRAGGRVRVAARPRPPRLVGPSEHVRAFTSFSYKCDFEAWPHGEDTLSPGLHHSIQLHVRVPVCPCACVCTCMRCPRPVLCACARARGSPRAAWALVHRAVPESRAWTFLQQGHGHRTGTDARTVRQLSCARQQAPPRTPRS